MATRRSSPSVGPRSQWVRSSCSRSRGRSRSTPRSCSCSTRRPPPSTPRPSGSSRTRSRSSCAAARRSSSRTASRRSRTSTASSSCTRAGSSRRAPTAICSRSAASTIGSTSCSTEHTRPPRRSRLVGGLLPLLLLAVACAQSQPSPSQAPGRTAAPLAADRIQLLHTNDIHGKLESTRVTTGSSGFEQGGMASLAGWVAQVRSRAPDRTLLLDAGDTWQGTFTSNANKGESIVKAMNVMRYDAQALGNHDFDWGQEVLQQRAKEASFPFLAANLLDSTTGRVPAYAKPWIVKDLGLAKIGIIGLANPRSPSIVKASSIAGLTFLPAVDAVRRYLPEVRAQSDIVVVLTHIGVDEDSELAQAVPDIDVIVRSEE